MTDDLRSELCRLYIDGKPVQGGSSTGERYEDWTVFVFPGCHQCRGDWRSSQHSFGVPARDCIRDRISSDADLENSDEIKGGRRAPTEEGREAGNENWVFDETRLSRWAEKYWEAFPKCTKRISREGKNIFVKGKKIESKIGTDMGKEI